MSTYFEHMERKHNGSEPVRKPSDIVEFPPIVVSEGELTDDMALALSLLPRWDEPQEAK
jgi:hypothetical protein